MIVYVLIALMMLNLLSIFNLLILVVTILFVSIYGGNIVTTKKQFKELEEDLWAGTKRDGGDFWIEHDCGF